MTEEQNEELARPLVPKINLGCIDSEVSLKSPSVSDTPSTRIIDQIILDNLDTPRPPDQNNLLAAAAKTSNLTMPTAMTSATTLHITVTPPSGVPIIVTPVIVTTKDPVNNSNNKQSKESTVVVSNAATSSSASALAQRAPSVQPALPSRKTRVKEWKAQQKTEWIQYQTKYSQKNPFAPTALDVSKNSKKENDQPKEGTEHQNLLVFSYNPSVKLKYKDVDLIMELALIQRLELELLEKWGANASIELVKQHPADRTTTADIVAVQSLSDLRSYLDTRKKLAILRQIKYRLEFFENTITNTNSSSSAPATNVSETHNVKNMQELDELLKKENEDIVNKLRSAIAMKGDDKKTKMNKALANNIATLGNILGLYHDLTIWNSSIPRNNSEEQTKEKMLIKLGQQISLLMSGESYTIRVRDPKKPNEFRTKTVESHIDAFKNCITNSGCVIQ